MISSETRNPVELARTLGVRVGVERGRCDEKTYVDALLAQLRRDRLIWAPASTEIGGLGLSVRDCARVNFHVGRLSGSAGLIYAMHLSQALTLIRHGKKNSHFSRLLTAMVEDQSLVASGTSEIGVGGDIFSSICAIECEGEDDLRLFKRSPNISYLDQAGAVLITAMRRMDDSKDEQVLIALPTKSIEFSPGSQAGFAGMKGIVNRPYDMLAHFGSDAIFEEAYPKIARATMTPACHIFWAALWSGIAARLLDIARLAVFKKVSGDVPGSEAMRHDFSRLVDQHHTMNALIRDAVADFDAAQEPCSGSGLNLKYSARIKRLKVVCSELLSQIANGAMGLVGISGYAEAGPLSLSEPIRDAMSARVMISNYRLTAANVGVERYIDEEL